MYGLTRYLPTCLLFQINLLVSGLRNIALNVEYVRLNALPVLLARTSNVHMNQLHQLNRAVTPGLLNGILTVKGVQDGGVNQGHPVQTV